MEDNFLSKWAKVSSDEAYKMASPEVQRETKLRFFKNVVAPTSSDSTDRENSFVTFMLATKPQEELYKDKLFLDLDEEGRKTVLAANIAASGGKLDKAVRPPTMSENLKAWSNLELAKGKEYYPAAEQAYREFENSPENIAGTAKAAGYAFGQPARKAGALLAAVTGNKSGSERLNKDLARTEELQRQYPGSYGVETAADIAAAVGPATRLTRALAVPATAGFGAKMLGWIGRGAVQAPLAAPSMITAAPEGSDIQKQHLTQAKMGAAVGVGTQMVGEVALNPTTRNVAARGWNYLFGKGSTNAAGQLNTRLAASMPSGEKLNPKDAISTLESARTNVADVQNQAPTFMGDKSGLAELADMQADVPGTNYENTLRNEFASPMRPSADVIGARADTSGIIPASAEIKTKWMPQTKAEYAVAAKNAVEELKVAKKEFGDRIYNQSRESGALAEKLGQSKNQFVNELTDIVKNNPELQKAGFLKVATKKGKTTVTSSVPTVQRMLTATKGKADLTVDDIINFTRDLSDDFAAKNASTVKPIFDFLDSKLSASQSAEVAAIRNEYANFNRMIDENIELTKRQFTAGANLETSFATRPILKSIAAGGKASNIAASVQVKAQPGEIASVLSNANQAKALKGAVAADMMDTLGIKEVAGKTRFEGMSTFVEKYGSDDAAANIREIFAGDKDFLEAYEMLRQGTSQGDKLKQAIVGAKSPEISTNAGFQTAGATGAAALNARTALGTGPLNYIRNKLEDRTRKYILESVTDKTKTISIIDKAIAAQKNKIKYSEIYDKHISKGITATAQGLPKTQTEEKKNKFTPVDLTKPSKSDTMKGKDTVTVIEPLSDNYTVTSPFDAMDKKSSPFDMMNEAQATPFQAKDRKEYEDFKLPAPSPTRKSDATSVASVPPAKKKTDIDIAFEVLLHKESGNRQVDPKTGKVITSKAGAKGAAQVMPKTGPEAAKLAGVPWNPKLYNGTSEEAKAYSKKLGRAYFKQQLKDFNGNVAHAYAAYNAGPNALKRALVTSEKTGRHWLSLLPAETRDYVKKNVKNYTMAKN